MAIGRSFEESAMKAIRSLETDRWGLEMPELTDDEITEELTRATDRRFYTIAQAFRQGWSIEKVQELSNYDPWFLTKIQHLTLVESGLRTNTDELGAMVRRVVASEGKGIQCAELVHALRTAKPLGFSDGQMAEWWGVTENEVGLARRFLGITPRFRMVDTCAAEFEAYTPYMYSTYEDLDSRVDVSEAPRTERKKIIIVGGGPIRIGQGIEFDYCVVHAVQELRAQGIEAIVINNNPETVSTDAQTADKLYFEPLNLEDVLNILEREDPDGIVLQFGGQTSILLAVPLEKALQTRPWIKTKIMGTSPDAMDLAEDRRRFSALMEKMHIPQPASGTGYSFEEVREVATKIGYPVLVRPSYVLGGRGMEIVYDESDLADYMREAVKASKKHPVLVDKYLSHAVEVDVDAICDGEDVLICGVQEHVEQAGVHSGDATTILPSPSLPREVQETIRLYSKRVSKELGVIGLVNFQWAVKDGVVYILEANPRASRTVPYVSKALGIPMAKVATRCILGQSLQQQKVTEPRMQHVAVKAPVFPFLKLPGVDSILGPEMKSTGEVMGIDHSVDRAYYKAMEAAGMRLPTSGAVYMSVRDEDKVKLLPLAKDLADMGFSLYATVGTAQYLREFGVPCATAWRIAERKSPDAIDLMRKGEIKLIMNTPSQSRGAKRDGAMMRRLAVELGIPFLTTTAACTAAVAAIRAIRSGPAETSALRTYY
jgi:carbamoyl-phosphate synthase large subunit